MLWKLVGRVRECLMESGSAVRPQLLYAYKVALGPLAVRIVGKESYL
jgi:hypothetical protein